MRMFLLLLAVLLVAGCGGDSNPSDPSANNEPAPPPERATIDSLITAYFPYYYSRRDSAAYDAMLLDDFHFHKGDPDNPVEDLYWDKTEELNMAGRMFRGTPNFRGQTLEGLALQIRDLTIAPSDHPDKPAEIEWFEVESNIELFATLRDPNASDGSGYLFLAIQSPQTFIVAPDPASPGDWGLVHHFDRGAAQSRTGGSDGGGAVDASWSDLKGLFR